VARSAGIQGDCGQAVRNTAAALGGRGGGRPEMAQAGGIPAANMEAWMRAVEEYFKKLLEP
jgi:alanyl-tRNA synthetase